MKNSNWGKNAYPPDWHVTNDFSTNGGPGRDGWWTDKRFTHSVARQKGKGMASHQLRYVLSLAAAAGLFSISPPALAAPHDPFAARVLHAHNAARAAVGAAPLAWDPALAAGAAAWAQYLAASGRFDHSDRKGRPGIGENLWMGTRGAYSIDFMTGEWIAERRHFVPGIFPGNSRTGNWMDVSHYTQIIWPTTTRIGCALASGHGRDYLVCRYSPKGNVDGRPLPPPPPSSPVERGR